MITEEQAREAYAIGVERARAAVRGGQTHRWKCSSTGKDREHTDGMAAMAECTVAEATGLEWTAKHDRTSRKGADVGTNVQVRWSENRWNKLITHEDDPDDHIYVLVVGEEYPLHIVGWAWGHETKIERHWRSDARSPAYFMRPVRQIEEIAGVT